MLVKVTHDDPQGDGNLKLTVFADGVPVDRYLIKPGEEQDIGLFDGDYFVCEETEEVDLNYDD